MGVMLPDIIMNQTIDYIIYDQTFADCGTLYADTRDFLLTNKFASWFQTGSLLSITSVPNKSFPIPNTTEAKHDPTIKIIHFHSLSRNNLPRFLLCKLRADITARKELDSVRARYIELQSLVFYLPITVTWDASIPLVCPNDRPNSTKSLVSTP